MSGSDNHPDPADPVYTELVTRLGEGSPQPRLGPVMRLAELLGDPHRAYSVIHVAGTNGKTSTSRMIEALVRSYGLRTGLFTSPHLERFAERICIDGEPAAEEFLLHNWRDIQPHVLMVDKELALAGDEPLTFFEVVTVLAFACFADAPVDVAIVEVGMGGEWDSTNIVEAEVAVFTPISLDHCERLGATISEIARTKSGIITSAQDVVSAVQPADAIAQLRRAAEHHGARFFIEDESFSLVESHGTDTGQEITVSGITARYSDVPLSLLGEFQAHNAALAIAAVELFFGSQTVPDDVLFEAFARVTSPGRLHRFGEKPPVYGDAAHNPGGMQNLRDSLSEFVEPTELAIVFGVLDDKDLRGIIEPLVDAASRWFVTRPCSSRARDPHEVSQTISSMTASPVEVFGEVSRAIEAARQWASEDARRGVIVTGSVLLVGDALRVAGENGWRT